MKTLILCLCLMFLAGCSGIIVNKFDPTSGNLKERVIVTSRITFIPQKSEAKNENFIM